jgi:hypothetical protein
VELVSWVLVARARALARKAMASPSPYHLFGCSRQGARKKGDGFAIAFLFGCHLEWKTQRFTIFGNSKNLKADFTWCPDRFDCSFLTFLSPICEIRLLAISQGTI